MQRILAIFGTMGAPQRLAIEGHKLWPVDSVLGCGERSDPVQKRSLKLARFEQRDHTANRVMGGNTIWERHKPSTPSQLLTRKLRNIRRPFTAGQCSRHAQKENI